MKKSRYTFGYLFVRFSKMLAALMFLAAVGGSVYLWFDYLARVENLAYQPTGSLQVHCTHLQEELEFAKKEVSRIGSVEDLSVLKFSSECSTAAEFALLLGQLKAAQERESILKERLMAGFVSRVEALRAIIKTTISSIEASRAASRVQSPASTTTTTTVTVPASPLKPVMAGQRTVFESLESRKLDEMTGMMNRVGDFFDRLASDAEREENKRRIEDAHASLNDLIAWLPRKASLASQPQAPLQLVPAKPPTSDTSPAPDPLVEAQKNYENLGSAIEVVRAQVTRDWRLDRVLLETMHAAEEESAKCRASEGQIKVLRLEFLGKAGATLGLGLAVAFLILVFADLLQSFFDTASNSAALVELRERELK